MVVMVTIEPHKPTKLHLTEVAAQNFVSWLVIVVESIRRSQASTKLVAGTDSRLAKENASWRRK
jgi:hypothetical protein